MYVRMYVMYVCTRNVMYVSNVCMYANLNNYFFAEHSIFKS